MVSCTLSTRAVDAEQERVRKLGRRRRWWNQGHKWFSLPWFCCFSYLSSSMPEEGWLAEEPPFCLHLLPSFLSLSCSAATALALRPWPNDQTLLVKHCFTTNVWPFGHAVKHFGTTKSLLMRSTNILLLRNVVRCRRNIFRLLKLEKQKKCLESNVRKRPNDQTLFDKQKEAKFVAWRFWKVQKHIFLDASKKMLDEQFFGRGQTVKHFAPQANFKCLTNNVWSFGQALRACFSVSAALCSISLRLCAAFALTVRKNGEMVGKHSPSH